MRWLESRKLLLLDEATSALDSIRVRVLEDCLVRHQKGLSGPHNGLYCPQVLSPLTLLYQYISIWIFFLKILTLVQPPKRLYPLRESRRMAPTLSLPQLPSRSLTSPCLSHLFHTFNPCPYHGRWIACPSSPPHKTTHPHHQLLSLPLHLTGTPVPRTAPRVSLSRSLAHPLHTNQHASDQSRRAWNGWKSFPSSSCMFTSPLLLSLSVSFLFLVLLVFSSLVFYPLSCSLYWSTYRHSSTLMIKLEAVIDSISCCRVWQWEGEGEGKVRRWRRKGDTQVTFYIFLSFHIQIAWVGRILQRGVIRQVRADVRVVAGIPHGNIFFNLFYSTSWFFSLFSSKNAILLSLSNKQHIFNIH